MDWENSNFGEMKSGGFKAQLPDYAVPVIRLRQWSCHVVGTIF